MLDREQAAELKASAERLALAVGYRGAAPSSSSTTPARRSSRSSRSTPGCRSSTRSPRSPPASTWSRRSSTSPPAAALEGDQAGRARARRRGPAQRRGPRPRLRPVARPDRAAGAALRPRHPGRHRRQRGRHHPGRLRLDDRQDHRLRPHPRRGAGPAAPGAGRDHGDHRGRRDQQELPARPARPARGDRRPAADTGWIDRVRAEGRLVSHRHSGVALVAAAIEAYEDEERARDDAAARHRARRPPAGAARGRPRRRPQAAGHGVPGDRRAGRPAPLPRRRRRRRRRRRWPRREIERLDEYTAG